MAQVSGAPRPEGPCVIITRSPLRISLGGGGTDLPSYYNERGGFLIAAAIDKYVYINIHRRFVDGYLLKYSRLEEAHTIDEIHHPIIRESLRYVGVPANLEITSMADIPAGTGLGSSGSFTTALLKALHSHRKSLVHPQELAEEACHIELDLLRGGRFGRRDGDRHEQQSDEGTGHSGAAREEHREVRGDQDANSSPALGQPCVPAPRAGAGLSSS